MSLSPKQLESIIGLSRSMADGNGAVNVNDESTPVLAANEDRSYACIVNDSDAVIYLAIDAPAILHSGIRLNANGGTYEITSINLHKLAVNGIHEATGEQKVLTKVEGNR